jgi:LysM repeat protein
VSLSAHLTAGTAEHGRLRFHPDCPRCRAERLAGSLGTDALASRRARAALAAGLLAFPAAAPSAAAQAPEMKPRPDAAPAPGGLPPGLQPEFDPGGEDSFDYEATPLPGGPEAGGQEDEGVGPPVETEPTTGPEAPLPLEQEAPAPIAPTPAPTTPEPTPAPAPAPPLPSPPAPVPAPQQPASPPLAEVEQPAPQPGPREKSTTTKPREDATKTREVERRPVVGTSPTPPPKSAAPVVLPVVSPAPTAPVSQPAPPTTAPVSQPSAPPSGPIRGPRYTVRAGDSLWSIARGILGPDASAGRIAREVNRLWELNRERIGTGNPSLINVGTVLEL